MNYAVANLIIIIIGIVSVDLQCESKNSSPLKLFVIFSLKLRISW